MADKAILLNSNGYGTARWLVYLAPHDTVDWKFKRAYLYADTAEQAIAKAKEIATPNYFKQYINKESTHA